MAVLHLKSYQQGALTALSRFLASARIKGARAAFAEETTYAYRDEPFGEVPCVCLRIPTGGGKTLLGAHAIAALAREWRNTDAPVALWLVPSETIRAQTLSALAKQGHPYREALEAAYGQHLKVCTLDELAGVAPADWGRQAVVVVATIQSFRVEQTDQRNVYAFSEAFERHFKSAPTERLQLLEPLPDALVTAEDAAQPGREMLVQYVGKPRQSLANWLALQEPLLIVDEAHNTKTDRSFEALKRLNPSAVLELTATPVPGRTNVLYHVSAQELAAESMIKLPIALREHPQGWAQAVFAAVQTQRTLEAQAQKEEAAGHSYLRPIVLFQAQNVNDEVPPEALRKHLLEELHIPQEQVAVATGDTREIEGVNLASRGCPIRFVITVQALREGWDCPFAYVLCSLQKLSAATAVEQLLGRVLRMPNAERRSSELLNRAYAHVCEATFSQAAKQLADRLINQMGFEALDVASMLAPSAEDLPLFGPGENGQLSLSAATEAVTTVLAVPDAAPLLGLPGIQAGPGQGEVALCGHVSAEVEAALLQLVRGDRKKEQVKQVVTQHNALVGAQAAPASRGARFAPIPTLGYRVTPQSDLWPLERESVLEAVELDLLADPVSLPGFQFVEQSNGFEIYVKDARVAVRPADASQLSLDVVSSTINEDDLVRWLDRELRPSDVTQSHLRAYLTALVKHLLHEKGQNLVNLARMRYPLARQIEAQIADLRNRAAKSQFRQFVLDEAWSIEPDWVRTFEFVAGRYAVPTSARYTGRYEFPKHFYPVIADLKSEGEEFLCAQLIDGHPNVKHWVRNLDSAPFGFWLPTSRWRFFPDFIAELKNGQIVVLEYKGENLRNDPYEIEKRQVGELWARHSAGRCAFSFIYRQDQARSMSQQIDAILGG